MNIIFSHPTGNANVRAALSGLKKAGILSVFHTSIAVFSGNKLFRISQNKLFSELKRRSFALELRRVTICHPFTEAGRLMVTRLKLRRLFQKENAIFSIDAVYRNLDHAVARSIRNSLEADILYSYEDGAYESFVKAKQFKIKCFYDLPIGYWRSARRIMEEERLKRPDWASTLIGFNDSAQKLQRKENELSLADQIIVASSFTKRTLDEYPGKLAPVTVIPYGFPKVADHRTWQNLNGRPLKLLFVGSLSQRKGIANVFEVVKTLGDRVLLTIVGKKPVDDCIPLNQSLTLHHWIPSLPHAEILKLMQANDVLVFPSLFEGFGLVITEAMSQGTPVITTDRTAGADLIDHGVNGWLVQAGSTESLLICIEKLINDTSQVERAGKAAMETASKRPWTDYSFELSSFIRSDA